MSRYSEPVKLPNGLRNIQVNWQNNYLEVKFNHDLVMFNVLYTKIFDLKECNYIAVATGRILSSGLNDILMQHYQMPVFSSNCYNFSQMSFNHGQRMDLISSFSDFKDK